MGNGKHWQWKSVTYNVGRSLIVSPMHLTVVMTPLTITQFHPCPTSQPRCAKKELHRLHVFEWDKLPCSNTIMKEAIWPATSMHILDRAWILIFPWIIWQTWRAHSVIQNGYYTPAVSLTTPHADRTLYDVKKHKGKPKSSKFKVMDLVLTSSDKNGSRMKRDSWAEIWHIHPVSLLYSVHGWYADKGWAFENLSINKSRGLSDVRQESSRSSSDI